MFRNLSFFLVFILFSTSIFAQDAIYIIDFNSNWNSTTHPTNYPPAAHWSRFIGATHNSNVKFLEIGQLASAGVEEIAELGGTTIITSEINTAITNGNAFEIIDFPGGFSSSIGIENVGVDINFQYVTLMSMMAPSPDWLAEVNNIKLTDAVGNWKAIVSVDVYATDTGTDSGSEYISVDDDTNPRENVHSLQNVPPFSDQIIGTFVFTLDRVLSVDNLELEKTISIYPNPSRREVFIKNLGFTTLKSAEIYSITGRRIKCFENISNQKRINLTAFKSGVYLLKLYTNVGTITKKLIIE